jgi:hypothetical protein
MRLAPLLDLFIAAKRDTKARHRCRLDRPGPCAHPPPAGSDTDTPFPVGSLAARLEFNVEMLTASQAASPALLSPTS